VEERSENNPKNQLNKSSENSLKNQQKERPEQGNNNPQKMNSGKTQKQTHQISKNTYPNTQFLLKYGLSSESSNSEMDSSLDEEEEIKIVFLKANSKNIQKPQQTQSVCIKKTQPSQTQHPKDQHQTKSKTQTIQPLQLHQNTNSYTQSIPPQPKTTKITAPTNTVGSRYMKAQAQLLQQQTQNSVPTTKKK